MLISPLNLEPRRREGGIVHERVRERAREPERERERERERDREELCDAKSVMQQQHRKSSNPPCRL